MTGTMSFWRRVCLIRIRRFACEFCILANRSRFNRARWRRHWEEALGRREGLFDCGLRIADCGLKERQAARVHGRTTGYRCINGESDVWPGLVLDRYGSTLVMKL